jgi:hypothetical protein
MGTRIIAFITGSARHTSSPTSADTPTNLAPSSGQTWSLNWDEDGQGSHFLSAADRDKGKLTNASVVEMVKASLGENVVIQAIEGGSCQFDVSPAGLIQLKKDGVPDAVITSMQRASKPKTDAAPANPEVSTAPLSLPMITLIDGDKRFTMQSSPGDNRSSGGPFGSARVHVLQGAKSLTRVQNTTPRFELFLPASIRPDDQICIIMPEIKKDERRIETARTSRFTGTRDGTNRKVELKFEQLPTAPGTPSTYFFYRGTPTAPLAPGEYVLVKQKYQFLDFGVDAK